MYGTVLLDLGRDAAGGTRGGVLGFVAAAVRGALK